MRRNWKKLYLQLKNWVFLKGENRKIINIVGKQGDLVKKFKESDEFFSYVGPNQSNTYFKIHLHEFFLRWKNQLLTLTILKVILNWFKKCVR